MARPMKYFTVGEFVRSDTAAKLHIDNRCKLEHAENIKRLVHNVLDPLREAYGKPIRVTSGYRCQALNKAVGGSKTSDHMTGRAADIVGTPNTQAENKRLWQLIQTMRLSFDQLIWEKGSIIGPKWVHISYRSEAENRKMVFKL